MEIKDIFLKLTEVDAPSGYEEPMMRHMLSELTPLCDEGHITPRGRAQAGSIIRCRWLDEVVFDHSIYHLTAEHIFKPL